jgi:hypothetical protein
LINGVITHVSDLWSGSISDKQITKSSGLIDKCEPGDAIMGDKGFLTVSLSGQETKKIKCSYIRSSHSLKILLHVEIEILKRPAKSCVNSPNTICLKVSKENIQTVVS